MSIFSLIPNETRYYEVLDQLTGLSDEAIDLMANMIADGASLANLDGDIARLGDIKHSAKETFHNLSVELISSFITPLDREDLHSLSYNFYRQVKLLDKIKNRLLLHEIKSLDNDFQELHYIVKMQSGALISLVKKLREHNMKEVQREAHVLSELEDKADEILEQLIFKLAASNISQQEKLIRKDIYEMFERLTDLFRDGGNLTLQILLKHS